MEINCTIFIRELAERTLRNYNYIKERAHEDNLYEVTQLINSMYCLLVVPEEIFGIRRQDNPDSEFALKTKFSTREKNLKKYAGYWEIVKLLDELKTQNRVRNVEIGAFEEECPVCSFLYNLRNSLCHEGIGFLPFQIDFKGKLQNKIDNIIFQAKKTKDTSNVQFIAVLSVAQLEYLLTNVATMYINVENGKRTSSEREYIDFYHELQKNVKNYLPKFRPY